MITLQLLKYILNAKIRVFLLQLPYTLSAEVKSNSEAMHPPTFNISNEGYVPTEPQTWRVDLPCMRTIAAEVDLTISLNVSTGSSSTTLHFRRKKICLKEAIRPAVRVDSVPHAPTSADIFYAGSGCAGGIILIAAIAAAACRARARKLRRARSDEQDAHAFLPDSSCKSAASYTSYRRPTSLPAVAAEERARDLQQRIAELTIQRCRVRLRSVAMEGTFGRVYRGTYADEEAREQEVLVKTVAEHASQVQVRIPINRYTYNIHRKCIDYNSHHLRYRCFFKKAACCTDSITNVCCPFSELVLRTKRLRFCCILGMPDGET